MPGHFRHLDWAARNEEFALRLSPKDNLEVNWAITILFYAALHTVDGYLLLHDHRPPSHAKRGRAISDSAELSPIRTGYRLLEIMSREARYELAPYGEADLSEARSLLQTIEGHVLARV